MPSDPRADAIETALECIDGLPKYYDVCCQECEWATTTLTGAEADGRAMIHDAETGHRVELTTVVAASRPTELGFPEGDDAE